MTTTAATCQQCDWTAEGDGADKAAEKHTKTEGHATSVETRRKG